MSRPVKIAESVLHHKDVHVRLVAQNLIRAIDAAKRGDIEHMATLVRIAYEFEQSIPTEIRLPSLFSKEKI